MNKVICDICGTAYPETEGQCPICGSPREYALENVEADFLAEQEDFSSSPRKKREVFDFDEVNTRKPSRHQREMDDIDEDVSEYEEESQTNVGLVVVLVILIALLLLATGYFFVRYMLPNMADKTPATTQPVVTEPLQTEPTETTEATIPCTNLMMDGGKMELGKDGKKLLNVRVYPENTTDTLTFTSENEGVVTISEGGTVTAVGEGQTVITIQCGSQMIKCNVTVDYTIGEETVPTGTLPTMQVEETEATEAATEETQATEETKESTSTEKVLKLKKTDITLMYTGTSATLELEGDLKPEDVTWFTMDSTIAIVHNGVVTSLGRGITRIYAEYNGQQTYCIVRCN